MTKLKPQNKSSQTIQS